MVQLKIQTNFVNLKIAIKEPSLSDCLVNCNFKGLLIKGALKNVSDRDWFFLSLYNAAVCTCRTLVFAILKGILKNH